ncbi:MAG TPA: PQQ-binding-like beta-propeller repeat protein [Miltoncostaeaceae bacterium]|nr:PQQ-binding-like beta-propeller repeat protein [Miltoncostaeaceae bacterium]
MTRCLAATLAAVLALGAGSASAAVRVAPGWPRAVPAGPVLQGPGGGVVVVSTVARSATVRAFTVRGARLWRQSSVFGCGNCDDGPQPEALQPDGTYGPIGVEGDDFWAVDARGRRVRGCAGVVFADGGCVTASPGSAIDAHPGFTGAPTGGATWRVADARWNWFPEFEVPPMAVRDAGSRIYAAFRFPTEVATQRRVPGLLIAIDPVTRTLLWEREGPGEALAGLPSGVLVAEDGGVTAYGADGTVRWRRGVPPHQAVAPGDTVVDAARGRLYLGRIRGGTPGVTSLDLATGAQLWKTRPSDQARLLSVGRGGRVYVAIDAAARRGVRALRLATGATAWGWRTSLPVLGARELPGGLVAVSAGQRYAPTRADRLTVLVPG